MCWKLDEEERKYFERKIIQMIMDATSTEEGEISQRMNKQILFITLIYKEKIGMEDEYVIRKPSKKIIRRITSWDSLGTRSRKRPIRKSWGKVKKDVKATKIRKCMEMNYNRSKIIIFHLNKQILQKATNVSYNF